jgi:hypothetical protein
MYILISAAIALAAIVLIFPDNKETANVPASAPVDASSVGRRIDYFASHGWEVEEIAEKNIVIPSDFSQSYEQYAQIQDKQGMPLREYAGRNAQLYVYDVKNYSPGSRKMLAELLVCDDTAIASMVYSEDGGSLRLAVS